MELEALKVLVKIQACEFSVQHVWETQFLTIQQSIKQFNSQNWEDGVKERERQCECLREKERERKREM